MAFEDQFPEFVYESYAVPIYGHCLANNVDIIAHGYTTEDNQKRPIPNTILLPLYLIDAARFFFNRMYASYVGVVPSRNPLWYASLFLMSLRFSSRFKFSTVIPSRFLTI